jgi:acetylornithine deacetylase/succinyl-diaminopimelate desuccinylase-like protein
MSSTPPRDPSSRRTALLSELVGINSVNPGQAGERSGPGGERELAERVANRAESLGAEVRLDEVESGRPNVYARFPGRSDRVVAVDVHLDTVGVEHMEGDPFDGRVADGRVYGRGSVDTKATLAVLLTILEDAAAGDFGLDPTLLLVGTISEEMGGLLGAHGFREFMEGSSERLDGLVVAEPTLCAPVHGHKGGLGLEICVHGHAAHSSKPHLGANAITGAARIITALDREHQALAAADASTPMGTGTLSVTEISGGLARNIIPDACELYAGRRVAPGEDPERIFEELSAVIRRAADPLEVSVAMANGRSSPAFWRDPDSPLIQELAGIAESSPELATYGSNALVYGDLADGLVVFGPGSIDQAHQAVEWIDISELDRADRIYRTWLSGAAS